MSDPGAPDPSANLTSVIVIGGGTMGAGIAATVLASGIDVTLVERDQDSASIAGTRVERLVERARQRTPTLQPGTLQSVDTLPVDLAPSLVIESVPEDLTLKRRVLTVAGELYPTTLLATNTSALSITELAHTVPGPHRFLGLHFFNPVPQSVLIEIVRSKFTGSDALSAAHDWVAVFGKASIEVDDSPGFATSRLGIAIGLEAIRMVEEGIASPADIDRGMVLGYKFPIGPLELSDLVGLDVRLAIARHLSSELGPRFDPPPLLIHMVAEGNLGVKSGRGFYEWQGSERVPAR